MQKGSGAFGARVLWFVRFAPNHGFRPQGGLVQRELYMPPVGGSRGAAIKLIARRAIPPPFEPSESFEPSEPSRPKGVSNGNPQPSGPEGPSNLRTFLQPFPADWYLSTYASLSSCTEILHFVQNDASGGKYASDSFSIPHSPFSILQSPVPSFLVH